MNETELEASLQTFLHDVLRLAMAPVDPGLELVTEGHIDSMDLVRLAAHLEDVLGIEISDEDVNDKHFGSVRKMLAYAASRR